MVGCVVFFLGVCATMDSDTTAVSGEVNDITWTCSTSPYQNFTVL